MGLLVLIQRLGVWLECIINLCLHFEGFRSHKVIFLKGENRYRQVYWSTRHPAKEHDVGFRDRLSFQLLFDVSPRWFFLKDVYLNDILFVWRFFFLSQGQRVSRWMCFDVIYIYICYFVSCVCVFVSGSLYICIFFVNRLPSYVHIYVDRSIDKYRYKYMYISIRGTWLPHFFSRYIKEVRSTV